MVAAEDARAVEVHRERLVVFRHLLASLDDFRHVMVGRVADELQGQMDLVGLAPVDVSFLVLQIALQALRKGREIGAATDRDG